MFFLIHFLHVKLRLMFNLNIPKDAASSGFLAIYDMFENKRIMAIKT
jgi:hypothetical protein